MNGISSAQEQNARNMKDFLELYNKLTEQCFQRCVTNFNNRELTTEENACVGVCADRYVKYNQRLMFTFMEFQNAKQDVAIKEMERAAAEGRAPNLPGFGPQGQLGEQPTSQTDMTGTATETLTAATIPSDTSSDPR